MLRAGVEGLPKGPDGHPPPIALAVTVLTSDGDSAFDAGFEAAATAGCDGVVCSAGDRGGTRARAGS